MEFSPGLQAGCRFNLSISNQYKARAKRHLPMRGFLLRQTGAWAWPVIPEGEQLHLGIVEIHNPFVPACRAFSGCGRNANHRRWCDDQALTKFENG
jgi:hypothetical protein